jgi:hypothetical protein
VIASIASQESGYECYLNLSAKYVNLGITKPLDEKLIFSVVSKLTNPPKKLIHDSYVHNQITADSLKLNLAILNKKINFTHESQIIEPCFFDLSFSQIIMSPDKWVQQYLPLCEVNLELPILKLNMHKQFVFILSDYLENYFFPVLSSQIFETINHRPNFKKYHMKKAKLRQIIYKKLIEDYLSESKQGKTEVLRFGINDLKFKHSITKIIQIFQVNWNMCNLYLINNDKGILFY